MSSIMKANLHGLMLFIWAVSVLTSSVTNDVKTDVTSQITNTSATNLSRTDHETQVSLSSVSDPVSKYTSPKILRNNTTPLFAGEGGPITIVSTTQQIPSKASSLKPVSENYNAEESTPEESDNPIKILRHGTQLKIVPRKGANQIIVDIKGTDLPLNTTTDTDGKSTTELSAVTKAAHMNDEHNVDENSPKPDTNVVRLTDTTGTSASSHNANASGQISSTDATSKTSTTKKHKHKPTVLTGGPEVDKPISSLPTKSPPLGMPRKIDYIVPIVITVIAVPLLAAATFMVYRQGRDCWDKRHYRRMDFLIDGMYND